MIWAITPLSSGDLSRWARQGVLMLNSVLTVLANKPASHSGLGWEEFTNAVIMSLNTQRSEYRISTMGKICPKQGRSN